MYRINNYISACPSLSATLCTEDTSFLTETGSLICDAESLQFINGSPEVVEKTGSIIQLAEVLEAVAPFPQLMLYFGIYASEECRVCIGYYLCHYVSHIVQIHSNKLVFLKFEPIPESDKLLSSLHSNFLQYCLVHSLKEEFHDVGMPH